MIDPSWISWTCSHPFGIGLIGTFSRKNGIVVLMCIELMLNAANLNFVAGALNTGGVEGWVYTAVAIAIAAAEVAIGLAILLSFTVLKRRYLLMRLLVLRN